MKYKIGDWVTVLDENIENINNYHIGEKTFKIGYMSGNGKGEFVCEESEDIGNGIFFGAFRKAFSYEIPGYVIPKQENMNYLTKLFKKLNIK